jgi:WD40 repeat protein
LFRELGDIKISKGLIFMGFKSGDTEIFNWNEEEKEFYKLSCEKMDEHEDLLESVDTLNERGLFVTGGKDGLVKVWNIKKELIREIKFPDPITSVLFLNNDADLLIGHIGKVSSVLAKDYKPFETPDFAEPS